MSEPLTHSLTLTHGARLTTFTTLTTTLGARNKVYIVFLINIPFSSARTLDLKFNPTSATFVMQFLVTVTIKLKFIKPTAFFVLTGKD